MTNIIQKIIDNKDKIVGIKIDGNFYDVDCYDQLAADDIIVNAHTIDNYGGDGVMTFEFTVKEIKNAKEVKLYKLSEV